MKQLFIALVIAGIAVSCQDETKGVNSAQEAAMKKAAADTANYTTVEWLDTSISFGTIHQGDTIHVKFRCRNTGSHPLVITAARPHCGCTIADFTREPIPPGGEGWVTAFFNSTSFSGMVRKTLVASTNTSNGTDRELEFDGNILTGNEKSAPPPTTGRPRLVKIPQ